MNCPVCAGKTKVHYCLRDCEGVYRKRKCLECGYIFFTTEIESDSVDYKRVEQERIMRYKKEKKK